MGEIFGGVANRGVGGVATEAAKLDLPFLGVLFRNKSFKGNRTELVIFITPRLLTEGADSPNVKELAREKQMIEKYAKTVGNLELID